MDANLAGRVLLPKVLLRQPKGARLLPLAAWPIVLSRVNILERDSTYDSDAECEYRIPFNRESSVFFLLRHSPVLFESQQLGNDGM